MVMMTLFLLSLEDRTELTAFGVANEGNNKNVE